MAREKCARNMESSWFKRFKTKLITVSPLNLIVYQCKKCTGTLRDACKCGIVVQWDCISCDTVLRTTVRDR